MTVSKAKGTEPLISHHFNNIKYGNTATDEKGRIQSVFSMQVSHPKLNKGKPTLIPSIYDGKVLDEDAAIKAAVDSGIKWTSADSHEELRKYDTEIHKRMSPSLGEKRDSESFGKGGTVATFDNGRQPWRTIDDSFLKIPGEFSNAKEYTTEPDWRGETTVIPPKKARTKPKATVHGTVDASGGIRPVQTPAGTTNLTDAQLRTAINLGFVLPLREEDDKSEPKWFLKADADIGGSAFGHRIAGKTNHQANVWLSKLALSIIHRFSDGGGEAGVEGRLNPRTNDWGISAAVKLPFNRGGTMALQEQMSMFDDGGMMDEGNSVDPVSGNRVPVGSLQEEVRDDVPAQVSAGEYVVPADVVRYFGLEFFMQLRDKAKHGLARMEDIGQMGNAEEAPLEADSPFAQDDTVLVMGNSADSEPIRARGGSYVPTAEELGDVPAISAATGAAVPTGWKSPGASGNPNANSLTPLYSHTVNYTNDEGLIKVVAVDTNGKPMYGVPPGYKPPASTPMAPANSTTPIAGVDQSNESGASGVGDVGDSSGGKSVGEMSPEEKRDYAKQMDSLPGALKTGILGVGNALTSVALGKGLMTSIGAGVFGALSRTELDFVTSMATNDYNKAKEMLEKSKTDPVGFARDVAAHTAAVAAATGVAVKGMSKATKAAALSREFGATSTQVLSHAEAVSSGNAPAGSSPNSFGGYTTTGPNGFSTNSENDVVGAAAVEQNQQALNLGITLTQQQKDDLSTGSTNKDLQKEIDRMSLALGAQDTGPSPDTGTVGGPAMQTPGTESDDTGPVGQPDTPSGGLFNVGGLIQRPKRKAKNTKKKRRGLASR